MNPPAQIVHLVRHGQTDWNREHRTQGWADIPLNATGSEQADGVAAALAGRPIGAMIASDLTRARQTAAPLAAKTGLEVVLEPALRERAFGRAEGLTEHEINREFAGRLQGRWTDPDFTFEGGESRRQVWARVTPFLAELLDDPPAAELVLVSHGGALRIARAYLGGLSIDDLASWDGLHFHNGQIVTFTDPIAPRAVPSSPSPASR